MKLKHLGFFTLILLFSFMITNTSGCTIFTVTKGDIVMFAGNEDQRPNDACLIVDTSGVYGTVFIATPWHIWPMVPQTGVNEQGLSFDANWIPTESLNPHPERTNPEEWVVTHLLKTKSTVEEVLEAYSMFDWGESISYQVHFADAMGDAAVIHPGPDGELTFTRKQDGDGYLISTNFNLLKLGTGDYSCNRFETANTMLSDSLADEDLTVEFMASILDATHQEGEVSTIYSTVIDLNELKIYLYYDYQFDKPVIINVLDELLSGEKQAHIDELLPETQRTNNDTIFSKLLAQPLIPIIIFGILVITGYLAYRSREGREQVF